LNPDIILNKNTISELHKKISHRDSIGVISPNVIGMENGCLEKKMKSIFGGRLVESEIDGGVILKSDRFHGSCAMFSPSFFKKCGYFAEDFFLYWEEIEIGYRAKAYGLQMLIYMEERVRHQGNDSNGINKKHRIFYMFRNQFLFARLALKFPHREYFLLKRISGNLLDIILFLVELRYENAKYAVLGLFWGLLRRFGKSDLV